MKLNNPTFSRRSIFFPSIAGLEQGTSPYLRTRHVAQRFTIRRIPTSVKGGHRQSNLPDAPDAPETHASNRPGQNPTCCLLLRWHHANARKLGGMKEIKR